MTTVSVSKKHLVFHSDKGQVMMEKEPVKLSDGKRPHLCTWEAADGSYGFQGYVYTIKELGALVRRYL